MMIRSLTIAHGRRPDHCVRDTLSQTGSRGGTEQLELEPLRREQEHPDRNRDQQDQEHDHGSLLLRRWAGVSPSITRPIGAVGITGATLLFSGRSPHHPPRRSRVPWSAPSGRGAETANGATRLGAARVDSVVLASRGSHGDDTALQRAAATRSCPVVRSGMPGDGARPHGTGLSTAQLRSRRQIPCGTTERIFGSAEPPPLSHCISAG
jgi:hypothetical protein